MKFLFDLDGTVTQQETLPIIARHFGAEGDMAQLTEQAVSGAVPYEQSLRNRVMMLRDCSVKEVAKLLASVPLYEKIYQFISEHKAQCAVVTSNIDCWCSSLIQRLGCQGFCSQAITCDDKLVEIASIIKKELIVDHFKEQGETVVFIGDGHNDLQAMQNAHIAIAAGLSNPPASSLISIAHHIAKDQQSLYNTLINLTFFAVRDIK